MNLKTPGVYVEEVPLFPPSVAGVATAVPAFIGYTERIIDANDESLINTAVRITSFLEFTTIFGGSYSPSTYEVQVSPSENFNILATTPQDDSDQEKRYYLYDAVRHYFDNGGGPCHIVSVGDYPSEVIYGDDTEGLRAGLRALEKIDEVTILVAPDSAVLSFTDAGNLHKAMIDQCGNLKDRFGILDMVDGYRPSGTDPAENPVLQFRNEVGTENLKYAATYYPWLRTTYSKDIQFLQLQFVDDQEPPVAVPQADIDTMTGNETTDTLVTQLRDHLDDEQRIFSKVSAAALNRSNYKPLSSHLEQLRNDLMDSTIAAEARPLFGSLIGMVRQMALALQELETEDADNPPGVNNLISSLNADEDLRAQIVSLIGFEKNETVLNSIAVDRTVSDVENDYSSLNEEDWIGGDTISSISVDSTDYSASSIADSAQTAANATVLQTAFDTIAQAYTMVIEEALFLSNRAEENLFAEHPFFKTVSRRLQKDMALLPPSGAVAGVYATTDRSRGVWKAPANMSLRNVVGPALKLTDLDQESLNIHSTGKSINAIRTFTGKGILVWGARTLAGNDNEWRFINVRRFFSYVEESTKKATEPFVFEPNDANTWVRIRAMIENFLTVQWRQGALVGATSSEAFYVNVGLGNTMTQQDILEGRMIVEIGMAVVRPAEFIVLRFSHKMQEA